MGVSLVGGGGAGGKRPLDAEIQLVPMIDLFVVTISFLLLTAVWTQLERLEVTQRTPGPTPLVATTPRDQLVLRIDDAGYVLASTAGERVVIPRATEGYDVAALETALRAVHASDPNRRELVVSPDDGVRYDEVIRAMDAAVGESFPEISVSDGAGG